jgi:hypothetical protein
LSSSALAFAQVQAAPKKAGARTQDALEAAIGEALATITEADARGFFRHCGYSRAQ